MILAVCFSCEKDSSELLTNNSPVIAVEYGKSFGQCLGYCVTSVKIEQSEVYFTASGWTVLDKVPDIELTGALPPDQWNNLVSKIDFLVFRNMDEVIGCPDCADGGAEWIEITTSDVKHKVTFEFGNEPVQVKTYITDLRNLLNYYENQIIDSN